MPLLYGRGPLFYLLGTSFMISSPIGIFAFSGTGNTQLLAETFAEEFQGRDIQADVIRIEHVTQGKISPDTSGFSLIGIGFPIYGWDAPPIVFDFIKKLPEGNGKKAFFYKCPGDFFMNGGANSAIRNALRNKGYAVMHESILVMPPNIGVRYPDQLSKQLYAAAQRRIAATVDDILSNREGIHADTLMEKAFSLARYFENLGAKFFRFHQHTTRACTLCETCIRNCPAQNISRKEKKISFGYRCQSCYRCIYSCPQKAIKLWGLDWSYFKEGYDIKSIINDPSVIGDFVTDNTRGYYKRFINYLKEV